MEKNKIKRIHFVGVKGVGMSPLAIIAKEAGMDVSGSDVDQVFITDEELIKAGIIPQVGFDPARVEGVDLVITTSAHGGRENPEVKKAIEKGIEVLSQGEALGKFADGQIFGKKFAQICIAGSHGKTTTTAMIATMLSQSRLDPSFAIGTGVIPSLGASGHFGRGKYFVSEADEYFADPLNNKTPKFLFFNPKIAVVTNIDFDHPDIYPTIEDLNKAFIEFTKKITADGVLVVCGDGELNRNFLKRVSVRRVTFGFSPSNDYVLERVTTNPDKTFFWVKSHGALVGEFSLKIFGEQNALNALSAVVVGFELGLSTEQIKKGLSAFSGTKRRSELVGQMENGALLYDDYAHHPTEIKETLSSFRKAFPKHKIITVFQPHMYSRTKILFNDFASSFGDTDLAIIPEIFPSFREEPDPNFSSSLLAQEIKKHSKEAIYFPTLPDVVKYLASQKFDKNTIVLTMGAGDVYQISKELVSNG